MLGKQFDKSSQSKVFLSGLAQIDEVLKDRKVSLEVQMNSLTLNLKQLESLQPGDVIVIEHLLEKPLHIKLNDQTLSARAWLGEFEGMMSVKLHK